MKYLKLVALIFGFAIIPASAQNVGVSLVRTLLPANVTPVMHVETLALSTVPAGSPTATYTLSAPPIAAMGAIIRFVSSQVGGDVMATVPGVTPAIVFTLPLYSPFTSADVVTITYWSTR